MAPRTDFRRAQDYSMVCGHSQCAPEVQPGGYPARFYNRRNSLTPTPLTVFPHQHRLRAFASIADDMLEVDAVIARRLDSGVPLVGQVSRYIISAGGKRLRPALLLLDVRRARLSWRPALQPGRSGGIHPHCHSVTR